MWISMDFRNSPFPLVELERALARESFVGAWATMVSTVANVLVGAEPPMWMMAEDILNYATI